MRKALLDAKGNVVNHIEIAEGANYPLPTGWALADPDKHPMPEMD